jgi:hypothetical protein
VSSTVIVNGAKYIPIAGGHITRADASGFMAITVRRHPTELIELGLLVKQETCPASKTFVPLPGQGGEMDAMEFSCDLPAGFAHKRHHDPRGVDWL